MGQYYTPVIKRGNRIDRVYSHDFGSGLKLMEHSYVGNAFVNVVANNLVENPAQLIWLGDYAGAHDFNRGNLKPEDFDRVYTYAWTDDDDFDNTTLLNPNTNFDWEKDWYFVNKDKHEFLLMPKTTENSWEISPISLLTAVGNGRGGGDYRGNDLSVVGYWAGDVVELTQVKPENFTDITEDVQFEE